MKGVVRVRAFQTNPCGPGLRGCGDEGRSGATGWRGYSNTIPAHLLRQLSSIARVPKWPRHTSERICDDNLPPNQSHNLRWIMTAPTSVGLGVRGPRSGPGSLGENRPRFLQDPTSTKLIWVNIFSGAIAPTASRYSPRSAASWPARFIVQVGRTVGSRTSNMLAVHWCNSRCTIGLQ